MWNLIFKLVNKIFSDLVIINKICVSLIANSSHRVRTGVTKSTSKKTPEGSYLLQAVWHQNVASQPINNEEKWSVLSIYALYYYYFVTVTFIHRSWIMHAVLWCHLIALQPPNNRWKRLVFSLYAPLTPYCTYCTIFILRQKHLLYIHI